MPPRACPPNDGLRGFIWDGRRTASQLIPKGTMVWLEHSKSSCQFFVGELQTIAKRGNLECQRLVLGVIEKLAVAFRLEALKLVVDLKHREAPYCVENALSTMAIGGRWSRTARGDRLPQQTR